MLQELQNFHLSSEPGNVSRVSRSADRPGQQVGTSVMGPAQISFYIFCFHSILYFTQMYHRQDHILNISNYYLKFWATIY